MEDDAEQERDPLSAVHRQHDPDSIHQSNDRSSGTSVCSYVQPDGA